MQFDDQDLYSLEAERAVLGSCIVNSSLVGTAMELLKPDDFYESAHRIVFQTMSDLFARNTPPDYVTLQNELEKQDLFERLGGKSFLVNLVTNVTITANLPYHANIVKDFAFRRRLLKVGTDIAKLPHDQALEPQDLESEAERLLFDAFGNTKTSLPLGMSELAPQTLQKVEAAYRGGTKDFTGFSSGLSDLDRVLSGFQPGSLNIIAARPSMGKTALALNIAQFGGGKESNPCVLVFSLEMPSEQLVMRMFAAESEISVSKMLRGDLQPHEFVDVRDTSEVLSHKQIFIEDRSDLTGMDFRSTCRRFKSHHPDLALIIVDYIQLMSTGNKRNDSRQYEVSEISRSLKSTALELDCPIIALSQLSRETEKRNDKKPQLWDLRDSGAIEQDADTVMLLYRESYYGDHERNELRDDVAELRIAKNRNGATGVCRLIFQREVTRFKNYAGGDPE